MRYLLFVTMLLLSGCATTVSENMMADGNTWHVKINDLGKCNGYSSVETCVNGIKPLVVSRGAELCGKTPERVFGCAKSTDGGIVGVGCSVQCNDATTVRLKAPSEPVSASEAPRRIDQEIVKKAKRCQEKGGVWLNDICQIDVDAH